MPFPRVPEKQTMKLEHFIPTKQYRGEFDHIKPKYTFNLKDCIIRNLIESFDIIWNTSLDIAILVSVNAEKLNEDKNITELVNGLKVQKEDLIIELNRLLSFNLLQKLFTREENKIFELKDKIDQISNQIKYLEKVNKEWRASRQIQSFRNKILELIADKVSKVC